jgi:hypothetical protein
MHRLFLGPLPTFVAGRLHIDHQQLGLAQLFENRMPTGREIVLEHQNIHGII